MNAHDVLKYGHLWVHKHLDGLTDEQWLMPNVCGVWSVKEIIAHLASFECVLVDVFSTIAHPGQGSTPTLDRLVTLDGDSFNDVEVGQRQVFTPEETLQEYNDAYEQAMRLLAQIPREKLSEVGAIPWYGSEYSIDDFIVYQYYGHKREHCAQIAVYRDSL